jgi:hypothetical protein
MMIYGEDVEGSNCGLFEVPISAFYCGEPEDKH